MTTPTQAQIEAARKAFMNMYDKLPTEERILNPDKLWEAALAAAQVGETQLDISWRQEIADTIERCAQEVESVGGDNAEYHAAAIRKLKGQP